MPTVSRYGRIRKMSRRADEATGDSQILFFGFQEPHYMFLFQNLVDPADMWRYKDEENHVDECAECGCDISEEADVPIQCLSNSKGDEKVVCNECYEENRTTYYEKGFLEGEEIANTNECCNDAWRQGRPTRLMVNEDKHEHLVFPVCLKCECEARANGFTDYEPDDE